MAVDLSILEDAVMVGPIIRIAMERISTSITCVTHSQNSMAHPAVYVMDLIIPLSIVTRENMILAISWCTVPFPHWVQTALCSISCCLLSLLCLYFSCFGCSGNGTIMLGNIVRECTLEPFRVLRSISAKYIYITKILACVTSAKSLLWSPRLVTSIVSNCCHC